MHQTCRHLIVLLLLCTSTVASAWGQLSLGFGAKLQNELPFAVLSLQSANNVVELGWSTAKGNIVQPGLNLSTSVAVYSALIRLHLPLPSPVSPFVMLGGLSTRTFAQGRFQGQAVGFQLAQEGIQAGAGLEYTRLPVSVYGNVLYTFLPLRAMTLESEVELRPLTVPVPGTPEWGWSLGMRYAFSLDDLLAPFSTY